MYYARSMLLCMLIAAFIIIPGSVRAEEVQEKSASQVAVTVSDTVPVPSGNEETVAPVQAARPDLREAPAAVPDAEVAGPAQPTLAQAPQVQPEEVKPVQQAPACTDRASLARQAAAERALARKERDEKARACREEKARANAEVQLKRKEAQARYAAERAEYWEQRRIQKAEQELEKAQRKRMKAKMDKLYSTALVFYQTNQYDLAESGFKEILALDPCNIMAQQYLRKIKAKKPEFEYNQRIKDCERVRDERVTLSH